MPRALSPTVRSHLIERAAALLARREPVTLRSLVAGTGLSTMAVYTYFDGMPGLWGAVREEGFRRLADRTRAVVPGRDPVRHLAALGVAYVENALSNRDLARVMFDATFDLPDRGAADETFGLLVAAVRRGVDAGRFDAAANPADVALRFWASGHGIVSLAVTGILDVAQLRQHAPALAIAVLVDAGDAPALARRSVTAAWRQPLQTSTIPS
jgi:AcrR family transcriptional regulator